MSTKERYLTHLAKSAFPPVELNELTSEALSMLSTEEKDNVIRQLQATIRVLRQQTGAAEQKALLTEEKLTKMRHLIDTLTNQKDTDSSEELKRWRDHHPLVKSLEEEVHALRMRDEENQKTLILALRKLDRSRARTEKLEAHLRMKAEQGD